MKYFQDSKTPGIFHHLFSLNLYNEGDKPSYCSATSLLKEPLEFHLGRRYHNDVAVPSSKRLWSMFGSGLHLLFEKLVKDQGLSDRFISEKRYYATINVGGKEFVITGEPDLIDISKNTIYDYKLTSTYSFSMEETREKYEKQLNIYRYLLYRNGIKIDKLGILYILRDWISSKAQRGEHPEDQFGLLRIKTWSLEETELYIIERLTELSNYEDTDINDIPVCSKEYRWNRSSHAVMKKGQKRAVRVFDEKRYGKNYSEDAMDYLLNNNTDGKLFIEERLSGDKKCDDGWCDFASVCPYMKGK